MAENSITLKQAAVAMLHIVCLLECMKVFPLFILVKPDSRADAEIAEIIIKVLIWELKLIQQMQNS